MLVSAPRRVNTSPNIAKRRLYHGPVEWLQTRPSGHAIRAETASKNPIAAAGFYARNAVFGVEHERPCHLAVAGAFLGTFSGRSPQVRSNRSRFITLTQAATKSRTNFSCASAPA